MIAVPRRRLESGVRWFQVVSVAFLVLAASAPNAVRAEWVNRSAQRGASWLVSRQQANGAFFTATQEADMTAATLAAVVAGGSRGRPVERALDYIREHGEARATRGALTGSIIAGIVAGGADPRDFGGINYVEILSGQYNALTGAFDSTDFVSNLVAANGALAAGEPLPESALDYIRSNECPDGGFGSRNQCASGPDVDSSAWAVNVLVAAGQASDAAVGRATDYMQSVQNDDGGFGRSSGAPTNADSTGLAASAIWALGQKPTKQPWRQPDGDNPTKALGDLQDSSGGFRTFSSDPEPNGISTVNAVPARAGFAYPIPAAAPEDPKAPGTATKGDPDSDDDRAEDNEESVPRPSEESTPETERDLTLARSTSDHSQPSRPVQAGQSYSQPVPYEDPTSGRRMLAWAGLVTSIGMIGSGVRLLRYTRVR